MRTSVEKVRISDEAERVQWVSYSHIRSLSGLYIQCYLPMGETGETGIRTDCLNFDVPYAYELKNKFQLEEGIGIIYLWDFRSRCSSRLHKIS